MCCKIWQHCFVRIGQGRDHCKDILRTWRSELAFEGSFVCFFTGEANVSEKLRETFVSVSKRTTPHSPHISSTVNNLSDLVQFTRVFSKKISQTWAPPAPPVPALFRGCLHPHIYNQDPGSDSDPWWPSFPGDMFRRETTILKNPISGWWWI